MPTSSQHKRSHSSEPPEVVLRRRNNTPPGASNLPTSYSSQNRSSRNSLMMQRRDSLRYQNQQPLAPCLSHQTSCAINSAARPLSLNLEQLNSGLRSPKYGSGVASPTSELELSEPPPKRSLIKNVFEAEVSLWALSLSIFFAVSSRFRRHFILVNLCVVAPIFVFVTTMLSGWVVLFAVVGHFYYSSNERRLDEHSPTLRHAPPMVHSPLSSRSSMGSSESLADARDEPIDFKPMNHFASNASLPGSNSLPVAASGPRIYRRLTSVQRQYVNGFRHSTVSARA